MLTFFIQHITKVGLETFIDPRHSGGRINEKSEGYSISEFLNIHGEEFLLYKAIPVDVAIIRATTGDHEGNLSFEKESLYQDARVIAMAARSSGGLVLAQVERIAASESIPMRKVHVPGALVDCVVQAEKPGDSNISYFTSYNPSWSGEIRGIIKPDISGTLDIRKVIVRRAALVSILIFLMNVNRFCNQFFNRSLNWTIL